MADHVKSFLPRFSLRHDSTALRQRGAGYQFYRLVPLDVMQFSAVLGIENYTLAAVEKALEINNSGLTPKNPTLRN